MGNQNGGVCQLLVFCDASMVCYATTVYLRIVNGIDIQTNLIFSRVRLVPTGKGKSKQVKKLTIPRLELLAVLIGTRAANFFATELRMTISETIIWTDSQCVLHWLKTTKPLSVFVENRLKEIKLNREFKFRFIASGHNPADLATRGLSVSLVTMVRLASRQADEISRHGFFFWIQHPDACNCFLVFNVIIDAE